MSFQFGKKALLDAIKNHIHVTKVYLVTKNDSLVNLCVKNKINVHLVDKKWFSKFDETLKHQFIAFETSNEINNNSNGMNLNNFIKQYQNKNNVTVVILDEIEDSRNFGAILRSCAAFDVDAVIYKKNHQAPLNDLAIKTAMGAVNYLNLIEVANLTNSIKTLQDNGYWVYGTMLDETAQSLYKTDFSNKCVIVLGNEGNGISELVAKNVDFKVFIPMTSKVQSLNVSVAAGICLSEIYNKKN